MPSNSLLHATVKLFHEHKGFGFLSSPALREALGCDVFVFSSHLVGRVGLGKGEEVIFRLVLDVSSGKPQARDVRVVVSTTGGSSSREETEDSSSDVETALEFARAEYENELKKSATEVGNPSSPFSDTEIRPSLEESIQAAQQSAFKSSASSLPHSPIEFVEEWPYSFSPISCFSPMASPLGFFPGLNYAGCFQLSKDSNLYKKPLLAKNVLVEHVDSVNLKGVVKSYDGKKELYGISWLEDEGTQCLKKYSEKRDKQIVWVPRDKLRLVDTESKKHFAQRAAKAHVEKMRESLLLTNSVEQQTLLSPYGFMPQLWGNPLKWATQIKPPSTKSITRNLPTSRFSPDTFSQAKGNLLEFQEEKYHSPKNSIAQPPPRTPGYDTPPPPSDSPPLSLLTSSASDVSSEPGDMPSYSRAFMLASRRELEYKTQGSETQPPLFRLEDRPQTESIDAKKSRRQWKSNSLKDGGKKKKKSPSPSVFSESGIVRNSTFPQKEKHFKKKNSGLGLKSSSTSSAFSILSEEEGGAKTNYSKFSPPGSRHNYAFKRDPSLVVGTQGG